MRAELWTMIVVVQLQWPVDEGQAHRDRMRRGSSRLRRVEDRDESPPGCLRSSQGSDEGAAARGTWVPCGTLGRSSQTSYRDLLGPFGRDLLGTS